MGAFGSWSLGVKFGIVLCSAIGLTFLAGFAKLYINKRRLKKNLKIESLEAARRGKDKEKLVGQRELDEGDLFGVRALEHGYFGGVSQSRPSSPAPSTVATDWGKVGRGGHSATSSITTVDFNSIKNASVTSLPLADSKRKPAPSPLRLQPSDAELARRGKNDPASSISGPKTSPLPSPHSIPSTSPANSRPLTPTTPTKRPPSYLPRLDFPDAIGKNGLMVNAPTGMISSAAASIVSTDVSITSTDPSQAGAKSPAGFTFFPPPEPPTIPSRAARGSSRSIFPSDDRESERPLSSRQRRNSSKSQTDSVPLATLSPQLPSSDAMHFPQDTRTWNPSSPIIRDSIVSKKHVSVCQPAQPVSPSHEEPSISRVPSAASSVYSTRTSILDEAKSRRSTATNTNAQKDRMRASSTSSAKTHRSSRSISRTKNSLRKHRKTISREDEAEDARKSRERDQLYFDPRNSKADTEGVIHGRRVDFDQPRESPFSNLNATASAHSAESSTSSIGSFHTGGLDVGARHVVEEPDHDGLERGRKQDTPPPLPSPRFGTGFNLMVEMQDPTRLSVARARSGSGASQVSVSDFYDAYYRQSVLAQRQSQLSGTGTGRMSVGNGAGRMSVENGAGRDLLGARKGFGAGETIVEVVTPATSPRLDVERERFPGMV